MSMNKQSTRATEKNLPGMQKIQMVNTKKFCSSTV